MFIHMTFLVSSTNLFVYVIDTLISLYCEIEILDDAALLSTPYGKTYG